MLPSTELLYDDNADGCLARPLGVSRDLDLFGVGEGDGKGLVSVAFDVLFAPSAYIYTYRN